MFKRAEKKDAKARFAIGGVSGGGKSMTALYLASLIAKAEGTSVSVIDSERKRAALYADLFEFDVCEMEETNIPSYLAAIAEAAEGGYGVLVIDSYSHSWASAMGIVDNAGGWGKAGKRVTPLIDQLVAAILAYPGHVICTVRSKMKNELDVNDAGRIVGMKKIGVGPVARPDTEYEFDVWLDVDRDATLTVSKTRCSAIDGQTFKRGILNSSGQIIESDVPKLAETLLAWLRKGAKLAPRDTFASKIRFCTSEAKLKELLPELGNCSPEDKAFLIPIYKDQKSRIVAAEPASDDTESYE